MTDVRHCTKHGGHGFISDCVTCNKQSPASPAGSIVPDRYEISKQMIEFGESFGFPNNNERESFIALVDAVDLRLAWLERNKQ